MGFRSAATSYHDQDGFTLVTSKKQRKKGQMPKAVSKAGSHKQQVSKKIKTGKKTENDKYEQCSFYLIY